MSVLEQDFLKSLLLALNRRSDVRAWRQNTGSVQVYARGRVVGVFHAGPPTGAADISGIVAPWGIRLEIETKGAKTEDRAAQEAWGLMIQKLGGLYLKVRYNEALTMDENVQQTLDTLNAALTSRS